jgi:predicted lysophospholipase L1 biosynthesis ABC-type transport system permease subunit
MRIRIVAGRGFAEADGTGQAQVMLINETLARSGLLGPNPVGRYVYALGVTPWEVVGIVDDIRQSGLDHEPGPQVFMDLRQLPGATRLSGMLYFVVRTSADPMAIVPTVRGIARQLDPLATVDSFATMAQLVSTSTSRPRLYATLMAMFAGIAVVLAAVGIYGVVSYSVTQRTSEIGIRMALGASRLDVIKLMLAQSGALIAFGIAAGLIGSVLVTRYLAGMLFGLSPFDSLTYVVVSFVLAAVATLASYAPARRAANIDPLAAIRHL